MKIRPYRHDDEDAVVDLWERCGLTRPWNDPRKDIARKLSERPELFLVGENDGVVIATAMAGFDGHRGWVYYLAVAPDHRGRSYASRLMKVVEENLRSRGCPKINLMVRTSNRDAVDFYRKLGYQPDETICLGRRLIEDREEDAPRE